jgi:lycopene cyclase domain-containing protein
MIHDSLIPIDDASVDAASSTRASTGSRGLWAVLLALWIPSAMTLTTIHKPQPFVDFTKSPTPQGYAWSLALFVVPSLVLGRWYVQRERSALQHRAVLLTLASLVPLGFGLDLLFARWFFVFHNREATLGLEVPVLGGHVPVEEFVFYALGFVATLLTYIWADEDFLSAYHVPEREGVAHGRRLQLNPWALPACALVLLAAWAFKNRAGSPEPGFPGYLCFLLGVSVLPTAVLYPTARPYINWRALSLVVLAMLFVCIIWEASIGVPWQWWGYQPRQMTGLFVNAWSGLPIEELLVWHMVSFMTVVVYEVVKVRLGLRAPR